MNLHRYKYLNISVYSYLHVYLDKPMHLSVYIYQNISIFTFSSVCNFILIVGFFLITDSVKYSDQFSEKKRSIISLSLDVNRGLVESRTRRSRPPIAVDIGSIDGITFDIKVSGLTVFSDIIGAVTKDSMVLAGTEISSIPADDDDV
jgi:hypothetical protein